MIKKISFAAVVACIALAFSSCSLMGNKSNDPTFDKSKLFGLWKETHVTNVDHFVRFTEERSDEWKYFYGREWNEEEDVSEQDLLDAWEKNGVHGNGWFKFNMETNGSLTEIHLMDNGGADIPKIYVITLRTDTERAYYEKEHPSSKFYFDRVVEVKPE